MNTTPFIIDDSTDYEVMFPSDKARGYEERDFSLYPETMFDPPSELPDMSLTEIADRIREHEQNESSLRHLRRRAMANKNFRSLDQGQYGYCWAYSMVMAHMLKREAMNLPFVRLSAHAVGCKVKNFRNEGGWCGLSAEFIRKHGIPSTAMWKETSADRKYDTPATWENAKLHKTTEEYADLTRHVAEQNLTKKQTLICLVLNNPCATDWNWWGHSVAAMWATLIGNPSQNLTLDDFGIGIINSWTDQWGDLGEAVLQGTKSVPNGAICVRSTTPSVK